MPLYALDSKAPNVPAADRYWIAPDANVIGDVTLGDEVSIWFGCTIRADDAPIIIGSRTNIQDGSVLHVDPGVPIHVGNGVVIGHRVTLHGASIGDNTLVGMGAVVMNGAKIGNNCLIGANALITEGKEYPDNSVVLGSPAKVVRSVGRDVEAAIRANAAHYVERYVRYQRSLQIVR